MAQKYNNKNGFSRKALTGICIAMVAVLVLLLVGVGLLTIYEKNILSNVYSELMVEAGTALITGNDLLVQPDGSQVLITENVSSEQLRVPGTYPVSFLWKERTFTTQIRVVDTTKPTGTAQDLTAMGPLPAASDFIVTSKDVTDITVSYKKEPDMTKEGTFDVVLVLTDTSGNFTELNAKINIIVDTQAPVISGIKNFTVYLGDTVAYRAGITVTDDHDTDPKLTIDSASVDLNKVGKYTVVYAAADVSGNTTKKEATVEVREKTANAVDIETVHAAADKLLATIVTSEMTQRQQVEAIYNWARANCAYANHSDKSDYLQGAYQMLTTKSGDCFNFYAVSKLLFDRLGIANLDVRKVKNYTGDSDHFWSLVSLDDGKSWYHFDCTPRVGPGDDFCLVTDAFLDAYSNQNNKCHNRNKSLYPATPES